MKGLPTCVALLVDPIGGGKGTLEALAPVTADLVEPQGLKLGPDTKHKSREHYKSRAFRRFGSTLESTATVH